MTGIGKVFKGSQFIADVRYDHRIVQSYAQGATLDGGPYKVATVADVYLRISPPVGLSLDLLTLHMSDGKKQDFYVESADGLCRGNGGPY